MRRISFFIFSTLSALVLLFSYRTSVGDATAVAAATSAQAHVVAGGTTSSAGSSSTSTTATTAPSITGPDTTSSSSATSTSSTTTSSPAAAESTVIDGGSVDTRYGPVQVEITVAGGVITDVQAIDYPNTDRKDQQINSRAIPVLNAEVLSAQSANIDGVSGATYTSDGYVQSLQSALDVAGL